MHSTTPYTHPRLDSRIEPKFSDCLRSEAFVISIFMDATYCFFRCHPFGHLTHWLMVSYCDRWMSVVRLASSVVNNCFKGHLLLNYWLDLTKLGKNDPYEYGPFYKKIK